MLFPLQVQSSGIPVAMSTQNTQILVSTTILQCGSFEKQLVVGLGQKTYQVGLEHLIVLERKEALKRQIVNDEY